MASIAATGLTGQRSLTGADAVHRGHRKCLSAQVIILAIATAGTTMNT